MNEKDLLDRIKKSADDITPPVSLEPDAIEQKLKQSNTQPEKTTNRPKKKSSGKPFFRPLLRFGSIAAMFVLVATVTWQATRITKLSEEADALSQKLNERTDLQAPDEKETGSPALLSDTDADAASQSPDHNNGDSSELLSDIDADAASQSPDHNDGDFSELLTDTDADTASQLPDRNDTGADAGADSALSAAQSETDVIREKEAVPSAKNSAADDSNADSDALSDATANTTTDTQADVPTDTLTYADSYEAVYDALRENFYYTDKEILYDGGFAVAEDMDVQESSANTVQARGLSAASDTGSQTDDFSRTNLQEQGVDEADIVKTDGNYLYILRQDGAFAIVPAGSAPLQTVSITDLPQQENCTAHELYLDGDTLSVIVSAMVTSLDNDNDVYYTRTSRQTILYTYDISDRTAPKLTGTVTQDGWYSDSRKVGQHIYLFSTWYPDLGDTYEDSTIVPHINGTQPAASAFYLPDTMTDQTYLVISSVDTAQPDRVLDSKILVSGASQFYVSTDNIYIANLNYMRSYQYTEIVKFHYANGMISGVAAGSVRGWLNNSFSLNEYNGYLRVVSTYYGDPTMQIRELIGDLTSLDLSLASDWEEHNGLYIFDAAMQQVGSISQLAEGETVRSARFLGDTGYFVTFRQTDPLFSVDLSDPSDPKILGELKVSGFSSYLHFYGENQLLGIGYEADEKTGITSGLKLSMFDISDPTNVTETSRLVIPGITWCPAINDYKSILVSPEKNIIGFFLDNRYLTFSYDPESGFTQQLVYDFYSDMLTGAADYDTMRGLYIGDTLYLAGSTFVLTFDMENGFQKTELLRIE